MSPRTFTFHGPRLPFSYSTIIIPFEPELALAFSIEIDRAAERAFQAGYFRLADRLTHAAFEAKCRAERRFDVETRWVRPGGVH